MHGEKGRCEMLTGLEVERSSCCQRRQLFPNFPRFDRSLNTTSDETGSARVSA